VLHYRVAGPWNKTSKERNVQGTNRPGNETSQERNVHCVRGTKRLGNEKSINQNFNEDRPILSAAKCKPMDLLFSRNIVYADMRGGSIGEGCHIGY